VCCEDSDLVVVAKGEVGVDVDEDVCEGLGDGQFRVEDGPGARVQVDDDDEKRGHLGLEGRLVVVRRGIDVVHGAWRETD